MELGYSPVGSKKSVASFLVQFFLNFAKFYKKDQTMEIVCLHSIFYLFRAHRSLDEIYSILSGGQLLYKMQKLCVMPSSDFSEVSIGKTFLLTLWIYSLSF